MVTCAVRRSIGAVLGALVIGAALLLGVLEPLPDRVVTVAFLFGGGLATGLLTPGTVRDGAITGAVSGVLVGLFLASTTTIPSHVASSPQYPQPWTTFGFCALVLTIILLSLQRHRRGGRNPGLEWYPESRRTCRNHRSGRTKQVARVRDW